MQRLKGKAVVVTGSTHGIGKGIALLAASEGAQVIISGRNEAEGSVCVAEIENAGGTGSFIRADLTDLAQCRALIDRTVEMYGSIDGLVNNAGVFPPHPFLHVTANEYENVMNVNVRAPFFLMQRAAEIMMKQGRGSIVNIGSTHWKLGSERMAAYSVSKGALHTLTQHTARHLARYGIRVNSVTVGWVCTEGDLEKQKSLGRTMEQIQQRALDLIPTGKFQTPEDIAYACVFLLSDESRQVIGTDLEVTGGFQPNSVCRML